MRGFRIQRVIGLAIGAAGVLACSKALATPPSPLLRYTFNLAGITQNSSGSAAIPLTTYSDVDPTDLVTGSPIGPSGQSTDLSLNLGSSSFPYKFASSGSSADYSPLSNLKDFSITAWVQNTAPTGSSEYVFILGGSGSSVTFGLTSQDTSTPNKEYVKVNGLTKISSATVPSRTGQWTFLGVTYDRFGNINFYQGDSVSSLTVTPASGSGDTPADPTLVGVGNLNKSAAFQLPGALDDVQLFKGALPTVDMTTVRDADVPEPGIISLIGMAALLAVRWRPRRQSPLPLP